MDFYGGIVSIRHLIDHLDVISQLSIDVKAVKQYVGTEATLSFWLVNGYIYLAHNFITQIPMYLSICIFEIQIYLYLQILENIAENIEEIEEEFLVFRDLSSHPNIPEFFGLFLKRGVSSDDDQIWFVMEVCSKFCSIMSLNNAVSTNLKGIS